MSKYDLGIIDAQYILRRNFSILRNNGRIRLGELLKSFYQSIMKQKRDFDFERPILLFDKGPYLKEEVIKKYKKDRHYMCEDDITNLKKRIEECTDPEEKERLEKELKDTEIQVFNESQMNKAKYDIVRNGFALGFPVIIKQGFEADDIAFAIAEDVRRLDMSAILITTDRDWITFRSKKVAYSTPKMDTRFDLCKEMVGFSNELDIPLYEIGVLKEIYDSSHNNVDGYQFTSSVDFSEFAKKVYTKDETLPGYAEISEIYDSMNMRKHHGELSQAISETFLPIRVDVNFYNQYAQERGVTLSYASYSSYLRGLDKCYGY